MTGTPNKGPPKQQLLMLIETAPGKPGEEPRELTLMDGYGVKHVSKSADEFWATAIRLLQHGDAPALSSAPGKSNGASGKSNGASVKIDEAAEKQKLVDAFGTLGRRLKDVAEAEFGAPVVSAAATIVSQASKKASGIATRHSRKGSSRRYSLRRRARS